MAYNPYANSNYLSAYAPLMYGMGGSQKSQSQPTQKKGWVDRYGSSGGSNTTVTPPVEPPVDTSRQDTPEHSYEKEWDYFYDPETGVNNNFGSAENTKDLVNDTLWGGIGQMGLQVGGLTAALWGFGLDFDDALGFGMGSLAGSVGGVFGNLVGAGIGIEPNKYVTGAGTMIGTMIGGPLGGFIGGVAAPVVGDLLMDAFDAREFEGPRDLFEDEKGYLKGHSLGYGYSQAEKGKRGLDAKENSFKSTMGKEYIGRDTQAQAQKEIDRYNESRKDAPWKTDLEHMENAFNEDYKGLEKQVAEAIGYSPSLDITGVDTFGWGYDASPSLGTPSDVMGNTLSAPSLQSSIDAMMGPNLSSQYGVGYNSSLATDMWGGNAQQAASKMGSSTDFSAGNMSWGAQAAKSAQLAAQEAAAREAERQAQVAREQAAAEAARQEAYNQMNSFGWGGIGSSGGFGGGVGSGNGFGWGSNGNGNNSFGSSGNGGQIGGSPGFGFGANNGYNGNNGFGFGGSMGSLADYLGGNWGGQSLGGSDSGYASGSSSTGGHGGWGNSGDAPGYGSGGGGDYSDSFDDVFGGGGGGGYDSSDAWN